MRWENLYVAGVGSYLPATEQTATDAVLEGRYDEREQVANGVRAVRIAGEDEPGPVMAAKAARQAWQPAQQPACDLVLHAYVGHQGQDFWTPASYIQREVVGGSGAAIEIRQGSNGGLAALELAACYLAARPAARAALVTTGDAFHLPYFDRWSSDSQQVYGDGAGALVLSTAGGFARVLASSTLSDSTLEPIYRGSGGWTSTPFLDGEPADLRGRKRDYLLQRPELYDEVIDRTSGGLLTVVTSALEEAGHGMQDIDHVVHSTLATTIIEHSYYRTLGITRSQTTYDWGLDYGHLGAGDEVIALDRLMHSGACEAGDLILAIGSGIGYSWSAIVLQLLDG